MEKEKNKIDVNWIGTVNESQLSTIIKEITNAKKENINVEIVMHVQSEGGNPSCASAFYNWVKLEKINLITIGLSTVASAAIVIFLAGKERVCLKHTHFLLHRNTLTPKGTYDAYRIDEDEKILEISSKESARILKRETRLTKKEINFISKQGFFLTAKEAKKKGLVHKIITE